MHKPKHRANLRADAAWVIWQILEHKVSSRQCLQLIQKRHTAQDNGWLQEVTMGVMRQLPQLQVWLRELLDKPLKGDKIIVEHLLMVGFYQIAFMRVSQHAAVSETVSACELLGGKSLKGLANAVLRNFLRQEKSTTSSESPIVKSGLPKWLYKKLAAAYPDSLGAIIEQTNAIAPLWIRVNQRVTGTQEYLKALQDKGINAESVTGYPQGLIVHSRGDVTQYPGFANGEFAVQDGAAQLAAHYLAAQSKERILDCCAAPGGKTGHIVELQPDLAQIIALDNDAQRLTRIEENMQRLGHTNISLLCADAADTKTWWDGHYFDRILLDAPCSATGVIRRHPDIRWLRRGSDIEQLVTIQRQLLSAMWSCLKPGGTLLYATCSILPDENSQQIAQFLAQHEDASLVPLVAGETEQNPGRQILPGEQGMDGFYYARLMKRA